MINLYQQRDFGEKINATFTYATKEFRSLGLALLYIAGPVTLVAGIAGGIYQSNMIGTIGLISGDGYNGVKTSPFAFLDQMLSPAYWLLLLFSLLSYVMVSLTVYSHVKLYGRSQGAPISVGDVWQDVQASLLGGVGITLVTGVAILVGLLLLFVPGIYISVPLSLALPIFAFEGTGIGEVFSRCFKLAKDKWWSTLGLVIVMSFIVGVIGLVFSLPATIVTVMGLVGKSTDSSLLIIVTQTVAILGTRLLSALVPLALGFQYFNLVERQEGVGLLSAIDSIGTAPTNRVRRMKVRIKPVAQFLACFSLVAMLTSTSPLLYAQTPIALPGDSLVRTHDDHSPIRARYPDASALRDYQTDRNYRYDRDTTPPQSLWSKIQEWISLKISDLLRSRAYKNVGQYIVLALIAALVVWLLRKAEVLGFLFPKKAAVDPLDYENLTENIHEISFSDRIDEALAGRNYRLAVRLLYLRTLKQLTDRNLIAWQPNKTNRQYAHELANSPLRPAFEELTTQFEFVWYGDFPIDERGFGALADRFRQFESGKTTQPL